MVSDTVSTFPKPLSSSLFEIHYYQSSATSDSTKPFYGIGNFISMALHTAILFLVVGAGILFSRPGRGLTVHLLDQGVSGMMVRHFLPAIISIPIIPGMLGLEGLRLKFYDNEMGVALIVVAHILINAAIIAIRD
jgi:hypothetical protein